MGESVLLVLRSRNGRPPPAGCPSATGPPRRYPSTRADHVPRPGRAVRRDQGRQHPVRPVVQPLVLRVVVPVPRQRRHRSRADRPPDVPLRLAPPPRPLRPALPARPRRQGHDGAAARRTRSTTSRRSCTRSGFQRFIETRRPGAVRGRAADRSRSTRWWPRRTARSATRRCSSTTARSASST